MIEFWNQPWFGWGVAVAIGLPVVLVVLTELSSWLQRRSSPIAKPVLLLRNFVVPVGALLALLAIATNVDADFTWVRVTATVFGFLVILLLLSGVNVVIFGAPKPGSWRDRLPSIFVDIARLALIVVGLAVLFSWVWGADVGGLFTALGVTSIVIGLALQNAVGSIVSGLLLLFEQPFKIGDWLDTSEGRGRVVEVNWRSIHLETDSGTLVMPTAALADGAFTNLSSDAAEHTASVDVVFGSQDAPHEVSAALIEVATDLPLVDSTRSPGVSITGPGAYTVTIPILTPADEDATRSLFLAWLWYASTRRGLAWVGGSTEDYATLERREDAARVAARALAIAAADIDPAALRLERYAAGETVQRSGSVPGGLRFVVDGKLALVAQLADGARLPIETLDRGSYVGQTALTREQVPAASIALTPLTLAYLPREVIDLLVAAKPTLGTHIGAAIDTRRRRVAEVVAAVPVRADREVG